MGTFIIILSAAAAFGVTALMGLWLIPLLRRVKYGQTILDIGPSWHKNKQGTPTMGGFLFIAGVLVSVAAGYLGYLATGALDDFPAARNGSRLLSGLVMAVAFGFLGFVDDYVKVVKKRNMGLGAGQKFIMQMLIGGVYLAALAISGNISTSLRVPFLGDINLGPFYYPIALFFIIGGTVNAVNLTDGVDGLAASVTFVVSLGFLASAVILRSFEVQLLAAAASGAMLGFLIYNFHPAKVFMGDTGSLFLGGLVVAMGFGLGLEFLICIMGVVYLGEALSVILQVASFKLTGKRIFKMSPIHHHFELCGWSEQKIVAVFSLVAAAGCGLGIWWVLSL